MEIKIDCKTGQNRSFFSHDRGKLVAHLKALPKGNRANIELIDLAAKEFNVEPKSIRIIKGKQSVHKVLEVQNGNSSS